jgi:hypothetical protein
MSFFSDLYFARAISILHKKLSNERGISAHRCRIWISDSVILDPFFLSGKNSKKILSTGTGNGIQDLVLIWSIKQDRGRISFEIRVLGCLGWSRVIVSLQSSILLQFRYCYDTNYRISLCILIPTIQHRNHPIIFYEVYVFLSFFCVLRYSNRYHCAWEFILDNIISGLLGVMTYPDRHHQMILCGH